MWESQVIGYCSTEQLTSSTNWTCSNSRGWDPPCSKPSRVCLFGHVAETGERGNQGPSRNHGNQRACKVCKHPNRWHNKSWEGWGKNWSYLTWSLKHELGQKGPPSSSLQPWPKAGATGGTKPQGKSLMIPPQDMHQKDWLSQVDANTWSLLLGSPWGIPVPQVGTAAVCRGAAVQHQALCVSEAFRHCCNTDVSTGFELHPLKWYQPLLLFFNVIVMQKLLGWFFCSLRSHLTYFAKGKGKKKSASF